MTIVTIISAKIPYLLHLLLLQIKRFTMLVIKNMKIDKNNQLKINIVTIEKHIF